MGLKAEYMLFDKSTLIVFNRCGDVMFVYLCVQSDWYKLIYFLAFFFSNVLLFVNDMFV